MQAYIDTYAGPEYLIHYRFAAILLQIGVAFCYGCTMPPLYGIASVAFLILYINERLLICYYYREPPAFDEKMTMLTLDLVKYVPFMMLPMAFWQLGNRQIFENEVQSIVFKSDVRLSSHNLSSSMAHMDPTFMTYNSGPMWLLIFIILYKLVCWCTGWGSGEEEDEADQLVEGLADYYDALKDADKAMLIGHEDVLAYKYGCKTFSDERLYKLKNAETVDVEKVIMGVATYRILDSLQYQQALQYEPVRMTPDGAKRDNVIFISTNSSPAEGEVVENEPAQMDATYLAVNLAYLPEDKKATFNMDTSKDDYGRPKALV